MIVQGQPTEVWTAVYRVTSECPVSRCMEDHLYDFCRHWLVGGSIVAADWKQMSLELLPSKYQGELNSIRISSRIS